MTSKGGKTTVTQPLGAISYACACGLALLSPAPLTKFQIERMSLSFSDDVFLQDLSLEPAQRILKRFALVKLYFRHYTSLIRI